MKQFAIALGFILATATGYSQCAQRVTAHAEMRASSAVIVGTVTAAIPVGETWDFLDGINYIVHVDSVLHGKTDRAEYTIFSENIPTAFDMAIGKHYVLYLQPQYDRYRVNGCGNSHPTEEMEASSGEPARGE